MPSCVQLFPTPWTVAPGAPLCMEFPSKDTGVGCHFLLQGVFLTQGSNSGLQHCRQMLYPLSHMNPLYNTFSSVQLSSVTQSCLTLCNPMDCSTQASLSITNSWSLPKLMSIELVIPANHLILCGPLLLLPSIFPSIRVFSNESVLHIRWPKYCSFSFSNSSALSFLDSPTLTSIHDY